MIYFLIKSDHFQLIVLRSQGAPDSHNYIHQIIRAYPKFTPLLHSRIPPDLVPIIWNDPVLKQLASIIGNKPVRINAICSNKKYLYLG